jgi:hypothetical protein
MSHYADDVEYFSMFVAKLTGDDTGRINGKRGVREYLAKGLAAYPNLNFKFINCFVGVASITLQYESVNNLIAAEVFELNTLLSHIVCFVRLRYLVSSVFCGHTSILDMRIENSTSLLPQGPRYPLEGWKDRMGESIKSKH